MRTISVKKLHLDLSTDRIQALTDGVFAIAMTLLVLNLEISDPPKGHTIISLNNELKGLMPYLLHYVESFLILAAFWTEHHLQFHFIKKSNRTLFWINIAGLLFITFIPFSTSLVGDHGDMHIAVLIFELNMFMAGLIYYFHWIFAAKYNLFEKNLDPRIISIYKKGSAFLPVVSAIAIALSFISPRYSTLIFLIIPIFFLLYRKY